MGAFTWSLSDIPLGTEDNSVYETSSCIKTKKSFAWYRFFQSGYFLAWFLMILITTNHANHWVYLTNWGEALLTTYFVLANVTNICFQSEASEKTTNVLKKITSLFQHCSFSVSVTLTVAYWVLLRTELEKPRNWHTHGINMILVFVEVIITDIPVKMAHLLFAGLIYQ
ncbi:unnamed protein product [Oikopleura dioica]|uniref:Uncharacterized protein n=1 Tax=Oikopleura dioica TaxID=34765 RepID=E4XM11_OIKDI|nr:unnamed protein product [Oikopleura dioica]